MTLLPLGTLTAPSGTLLVVDPGYLAIWAHDRHPLLPEGILPDAESTARANRSLDLTLVGRDAELVGRRLDRQWHPRFFYDVPTDALDELSGSISEIVAGEGLDAQLEVVLERVSHARRVTLALEQGVGAGEVMFHGIWAGVIAGLPPGPLPVLGEEMPEGDPDAGRLRRVVIEARPGMVARSERFAYVMVDWARLAAVDVEALADWSDATHHQPLTQLLGGSPTASGVVALGAAQACVFATRWGDGLFEVHRDLDAEGRLLRVRIELGTPQRQTLMRRMQLRWSTSALVSRKIVEDDAPVRFLYRESPGRDIDSGWRVMSGLEDDAYGSDPGNIVVVPLHELARLDRKVDAVLDEPIGSAFERRSGEQDFERVADWETPGDPCER
jgi:hypothetical protein